MPQAKRGFWFYTVFAFIFLFAGWSAYNTGHLIYVVGKLVYQTEGTPGLIRYALVLQGAIILLNCIFIWSDASLNKGEMRLDSKLRQRKKSSWRIDFVWSIIPGLCYLLPVFWVVRAIIKFGAMIAVQVIKTFQLLFGSRESM